jgi:hypothetical protein
LSSIIPGLNEHSDVWIGWTPWNLDPYNITLSYTADDTEMPWYAPFLTASFLP